MAGKIGNMVIFSSKEAVYFAGEIGDAVKNGKAKLYHPRENKGLVISRIFENHGIPCFECGKIQVLGTPVHRILVDDNFISSAYRGGLN